MPKKDSDLTDILNVTTVATGGSVNRALLSPLILINLELIVKKKSTFNFIQLSLIIFNPLWSSYVKTMESIVGKSAGMI